MSEKRKPVEFFSLAGPTQELFSVIKAEFAVGDTHTFPLRDVRLEGLLREPRELAAFTLRKIQALHHVAQVGPITTADIVIGLAAELNRSLLELERLAESVDARAAIRQGRELIGEAGVAVGQLADDGDVSQELTLS